MLSIKDIELNTAELKPLRHLFEETPELRLWSLFQSKKAQQNHLADVILDGPQIAISTPADALGRLAATSLVEAEQNFQFGVCRHKELVLDKGPTDTWRSFSNRNRKLDQL